MLYFACADQRDKVCFIFHKVQGGQVEFKENGNGSGNGQRERELAKIVGFFAGDVHSIGCKSMFTELPLIFHRSQVLSTMFLLIARGLMK